jgi:hypothetical protein
LLGTFRARRPNCLPLGGDETENERGNYSRRRGKGELVAANGFLKSIRGGRRSRDDWLIIKVAFEI